jgi:BirA family biotin operon repressor/biotin-[acetyl-CoA-carboxylase] ligase
MIVDRNPNSEFRIPNSEFRNSTEHIGRRVLVFDRVDSTNTVAAQRADDPANDGLVILADEQTAGRGQYGRSWACGAGSGVLLSVLLFPPPPLRRPAVLAAWAAVSVCETIRALTGLQSRIKWPNDVLMRGKKVCGILIEQARGTVAGMGLNVNQTAADFAAAGLPQATSLALATGRPHDCRVVARRLIEQLDEEYTRLLQGDDAILEARWKWRLGLLGRRVRVECPDQEHHGRLLDVTWDAVELEVADGTVMRLAPERVRHVKE